MFNNIETTGFSASVTQKVNQTNVCKGKVMKKSYYLDLIEKTLSAYTTAHIDRYFDDVKRDGLKEHGFPRLTANIGILIANNRCTDLKERFIAMMDLCCQQIPKVTAANEFSVKEIICCLEELEKNNAVTSDKLNEWKELLRTIDPYTCYTRYAKKPEDIVHNWAAFAMVSEFMRKKAGLTAKNNDDFIDLQAYSQLRHLDSNCMYRDPGSPFLYDFATRGLFALLLHEGYQGKYRKIWQKALDNSAILTLNMLSANGDLPAGGRSQQFLHNDAQVALLAEYYAASFAQKGDMKTAGKFRSAAVQALKNISVWLKKEPISHIRNRFPIESRYGCEKYAYFDKYMITAASFLYTASRFCDDSIPLVELDSDTAMSWQTSDDFHMLFLRAGGYSIQYDFDSLLGHNENKYYDCSGISRVHRKNAPSEICMSVSCPAKSSYAVDIENPHSLSITPGMLIDGKWIYATGNEVKHTVKSHCAQGNTASAEIECDFPEEKKLLFGCTLNKEGLTLQLTGKGNICCLLPVFRFDGEKRTAVNQSGNTLTIEFSGYRCSYTVAGGKLRDLERSARNRNGHFDSWTVEGCDKLTVKVSIEKNDFSG